MSASFLVTFHGNTATYATEKAHTFQDHVGLQTFHMGQAPGAIFHFLVK